MGGDEGEGKQECKMNGRRQPYDSRNRMKEMVIIYEKG